MKKKERTKANAATLTFLQYFRAVATDLHKDKLPKNLTDEDFLDFLKKRTDEYKKKAYNYYVQAEMRKIIPRNYKIENLLYASRKQKKLEKKKRAEHRKLFEDMGFDLKGKHLHHLKGPTKLFMKNKKGKTVLAVEILDAKQHRCKHHPTSESCKKFLKKKRNQ